jgi:anti-anti-sigma factor
MSMNSRYEIENRESYALIRFSGFVDASTVVQARPVLQSQVPATAKNFIVDLAAADFLDSHGVGLFVTLLKRAHANHGYIIFAGAGGQPLSVLQMVGFNGELVQYVDDLAIAEAFLTAK